MAGRPPSRRHSHRLISQSGQLDSSCKPITAVIFDMDGLIVDSEPLWRESEAEVFCELGMPSDPDFYTQTTGMRINEVVDYWHERVGWQSPSKEDVSRRIFEGVTTRITKTGEMLPGVETAISFFTAKGLPLAIASSSSYSLITAVLQRFNLQDRFTTVYSAQDEPLGKPHPGVYFTTAQRLGVPPEQCLALEDSANGVKAAIAASCFCVAIPAVYEAHFAGAPIVLHSLRDVDDDFWDQVATKRAAMTSN